MKRLLYSLTFTISFITRMEGQEHLYSRYALKAEVSNHSVGIGLHYNIRSRWFLPITAGVSHEFHEKKWNDWYVKLQPYYLLGSAKLRFPVGGLMGIKGMNDYGHHFPVVYYGVYGGLLYTTGRQGIGVNIGVKHGKHHHLLHYDGAWAKITARETYRERPVFFSICYQFTL